MKYKNETSRKIAQRDSEIRRLEKDEYSRWGRRKPNWVKVNPYQDGCDVYFDVAPAYRGTVFEEKVWEVLPYLMRIGLSPDTAYQTYRAVNSIGYSYAPSDLPIIDPIDQGTYEALKISHDLFTKVPQFYDERFSITRDYYYEPNFLDKLVVTKVPRIITEENDIDYGETREEAEINDRLEVLRSGRNPWHKIGSTKEWRNGDRRVKRTKDKQVCKRIVRDGYFDNRRYAFSQEVKDVWWWLS